MGVRAGREASLSACLRVFFLGLRIKRKEIQPNSEPLPKIQGHCHRTTSK